MKNVVFTAFLVERDGILVPMAKIGAAINEAADKVKAATRHFGFDFVESKNIYPPESIDGALPFIDPVFFVNNQAGSDVIGVEVTDSSDTVSEENKEDWKGIIKKINALESVYDALPWLP